MSALPDISRRGLIRALATAAGAAAFDLVLPRAVWAEVPEQAGDVEITSWIVVEPDDTVRLRIPQAEIGQGAQTALAQLLAEEIGLDWGKFKTEFFDAQTNRTRHNVYVHTATLNSWAADLLFEPMRVAGAQVRTMFLDAASARLGLPASSLTISGNRVVNASGDRSVGIGAIAGAAALLPIPDAATVRLKEQKDWQFIGKPLGRLDAEAKSTGKAIFGIDVTLPGMVYAAVRQSPVFGGRLRSFDAAAIRHVPGVLKVVPIKAGPSGYTVPPSLWDIIDWEMDDAVAVVADSWWTAQKALEALPIVWDEGANANASSTTIAGALAAALAGPGRVVRDDGDADAALKGAARTLEAEYGYPFLEHAPMEPMNCTALVTADGVEAWAPTQYADEALRIAAYAAQVALKDAKLHLTYAGGGFGRRLSQDYVNQAVQVAKVLQGTPVKLIWSREETTRRGYYPPVAATRFAGGLDEAGQPVAWKSHVAFGRAPFQPYGVTRIPFAIKNVHIKYSTIQTPPPFGWMRGVAHTQNVWMNNGFLSELAELAGMSSYDYQLALLDEKKLSGERADYADAVARVRRQRMLLEEVARRAGGAIVRGQGRGRGIATTDMSYIPGYRSSCAAMAVDVVLDGKGGLKVERVVAVVDCGIAINPQNVEAQVQGGINFGISNALFGKITLRNGRVEQGNFGDYPILRLNDAPRIEVHIMPSPAKPTGIGEEGTPAVIAALVEAVYAAGGPRIRRLPIMDHDLKFRKELIRDRTDSGTSVPG